MKNFYYFSIAILLPCTASFAQIANPIPVGTIDGNRIAISSPTQIFRVGNAILLRHHTLNRDEKLNTSLQFLISCNESWISSSFRDVYKFGENTTFEEQEAYAIENEEALLPYAIEKQAIEKSDIPFAEKISKKTNVLCKSADREPKNINITISQTGEENDLFQATSFVTGTASRIKGQIDIWLRSTEYRRNIVNRPDGTPIFVNNSIQKRSIPTGNYSMQRMTFDCKQRKFGLYEVLVYSQGKITPETDSIPREKLILKSAVPSTVGEIQLDWICAIYDSGK